ncbi:GtrA family protein [Caulobacter sp.]|uniref:GtrA family protein n=1 Tax=Caulobacter sp. TaxID=78 RepID=UPI002B4729E1|nr:GtrA family protein [Caulobacter sp.]HJV41926.1 GtrA family protein [Caulobacter sp.]
MAAALRPRLPRALRELALYGLASVVALAVDWGLLVVLTRVGVNYLAASAAGFVFGVAVAYGLSIAFVFRDRPVADRRREFLGFLAVGLAGLLLTQGLMALWVEVLDLTPGLAKAPTAALVFLFNFSVRRALLFRAPGVARP